MKSFYLMFAACIFGAFCFLQWRGTSWDSSHRTPSPQYYSYRGGSSSSGGGGFFVGGSRGYSHK